MTMNDKTCRRYFDFNNRLSADPCAYSKYMSENESFSDYILNNHLVKPTNEKDRQGFDDLVMCNPNLRFRDGYGLSAGAVDQDSSIKYQGKCVRGPEKQQLKSRMFHAVPNLAKGSCAPNTESYLLTGGFDTSLYRDCSSLAEKTFDRYMPFLDCMQGYVEDYAKSVSSVNVVGMSSRDEMRRIDAKCRATTNNNA